MDIYEVPIVKRTDQSTAAGSSAAVSEIEYENRNPLTGKMLSERYFELLEKREKLPAREAKDALLRLVEEH